MHKLITLTDEQYGAVRRLQEETRLNSFSQLVNYLVLFYEQNQKRPSGRPKMKEDDANSDDDEEKYQAPDYPKNQNKYSYNGLLEWYAYDKRRGAMPPRSDLKLHPSLNEA